MISSNLGSDGAQTWRDSATGRMLSAAVCSHPHSVHRCLHRESSRMAKGGSARRHTIVGTCGVGASAVPPPSTQLVLLAESGHGTGAARRELVACVCRASPLGADRRIQRAFIRVKKPELTVEGEGPISSLDSLCTPGLCLHAVCLSTQGELYATAASGVSTLSSQQIMSARVDRVCSSRSRPGCLLHACGMVVTHDSSLFSPCVPRPSK
jgi:hypothetical protein